MRQRLAAQRLGAHKHPQAELPRQLGSSWTKACRLRPVQSTCAECIVWTMPSVHGTWYGQRYTDTQETPVGCRCKNPRATCAPCTPTCWLRCCPVSLPEGLLPSIPPRPRTWNLVEIRGASSSQHRNSPSICFNTRGLRRAVFFPFTTISTVCPFSGLNVNSSVGIFMLVCSPACPSCDSNSDRDRDAY